MFARFGLALLLAGWMSSGLAQGSADSEGSPQVALIPPPVLIVNLDAVYEGTLFGQRVLQDYVAADALVNAEDAEVASQLEAQELDLAERRATMDVEAFRAEADAFDIHVREVREARDAERAKAEGIRTEGRARFEREVRPILNQILLDSGALIVLQDDAAYTYLRTVDITAVAIEAFDAAVGDGTQ